MVNTTDLPESTQQSMTIYDSHNEWNEGQTQLRTLHEILTTSKHESAYEENPTEFQDYSYMKADYDFS